MLPKRNRVDTGEVENIFKGGNFLNSPSLTFRFIKTKDTLPPKISFIAPKSVARGAVKRNLLRRQGYRVLRGKISQFPLGVLGVFIFRRADSPKDILEKDIDVILNKI